MCINCADFTEHMVNSCLEQIKLCFFLMFNIYLQTLEGHKDSISYIQCSLENHALVLSSSKVTIFHIYLTIIVLDI